MVNPLEAFQIDVKAVEKNTAHDVAAYLCECWITVHFYPFRLGIGCLADTNNHHSLCAQMQRGANRRELTHRTISKVFAIKPYSGKKHRDRGRRHQMLDTDTRPYSDSALPFPGFYIFRPLVEGDRPPRGVAPSGNAQRVQCACLDVSLDALEGEIFPQCLGKRRIIKQGNRTALHETAQQQRSQPTGGITVYPNRIGAVSLADVSI